ncbi:unnamed protein product [Parnassius apollo]|uniref:(apollo) hypothetical protein n=1 Tax=Parnassius apollo TaxID=110799 RepID=A0A8S3WYJ6_PARAO|nr:unnamed protein product [Parnassius apollo]
MASPKPHASVSEELSEVQVLDSNEPLVTASSSAPSSNSARVLDSNESLVLPCLRSPVLDEPVAGPSGMTGPSGAAGSCGSLSAIASSSEDEGEEFAAAMPRSSGRRRNPYSDELSNSIKTRINKFSIPIDTESLLHRLQDEAGPSNRVEILPQSGPSNFIQSTEYHRENKQIRKYSILKLLDIQNVQELSTREKKL